jgi:HEAT repeat protein/tRNA A-37 threonylcarbamoyl transferase component Bud32/predicted RNA-binding Zn-ribbon protein involved in translation (DUF1610 family)
MSDSSQAQSITCTSCGKRLRAAKLVPGKAYKCPACGGVIRVPDVTARIEVVPAAPEGGSPPPRSDEITMDLGPGGGAVDVDAIRVLDSSAGDHPEKLGRYNIVSEIARGGMGVVYRAQDPKLGRVVALKVLLAGEGASREMIARFMREARSAAGLKHPGIVQVHDFGEASGQHYFTMDFVAGRSLDRIAATGDAPPRRALEIVLAVARALQFAHDHGIIHRDLKPANIIVTPEGEPVLTDFGLAKDIGDTGLSITGTVFGTPAYMSPEQAQGCTDQIDGRSDVYSLGVVLYELLAGEQPFTGATVYDVITEVITKDPPPPTQINSDLDADLSTICLKAMEKVPECRYATMADMADDIQAYLSGEAISARPPSAAEKTVRALRKNRKAIIFSSAGAAAAIALILGLWFAFGHNRLDTFAENMSGSSLEMRVASTRSLAAEMRAGKFKGEDLERAEKLIVDRLSDENPGLRLVALKIVAGRKLTAGGAELVRMVRSEKQLDVRLAAIRCRLPRSPAGLATALLELAADADVEREVRLAAVEALGVAAGLNTRLRLVRLKLANHRDRGFCAAVDRAMTRVAPRNAIMKLYRLSAGGSALRATSRAISGLQAKERELQRMIDEIDGNGDDPKPKPKQPQPLRIVLQRLKSAKVEERLEAVSDLGIIKHRDCVPPLLNALKDTDADVSLAAAESLASIGIDDHSDVLLRLLRNPKLAPASRGAVAHLLGLAKLRSTAAAIAGALGAEKNVPAARLMVSALGRLGVRRDVEPALVTALSEGAPQLRAGAAEALGQVGARSVKSLDALLKSLDDPEKKAAAAAAAALSGIAGKNFGAATQKWRDWWKSARPGWKE